MNLNFRVWHRCAVFLVLVLLLGRSVLVRAQVLTLNVDGASGTVNNGDPCPIPRGTAIYRTIQAAILCAETGDTIQIAVGTYPESLSLAKSLTLQGTDDITTIIDAGGLGRVLTVDAAVIVVIDSLTLRNGNAPDGGGIFTRASTLTIANSTISGNNATHQGGGIFTQAGTVTLTNTQVSGNTAPDGGGVFTLGGTVTLHSSRVSGNSATGMGGGIFTLAGSLNGEGTVETNTAAADADIHTQVGAVGIVPVLDGTITATVMLQGRPAAPDPRWSVTLQVTLTPEGGTTPVFDNTITTDQLGTFTLNGFTPGTYSLWVKGTHTLSNLRTVTLNAGSNTLDLGTLREGDTDDNNLINLTDFSLLAATFGKQAAESGYDGRADFNGDGVVNLLDFSLLASNFGQSGEGFSGAEIPLLQTESSADATLVPLPTAQPVLPTDESGVSSEATALPPPTALVDTPTAENGTAEATALPTASVPPQDSLFPPGVTDEAPQ